MDDDGRPARPCLVPTPETSRRADLKAGAIQAGRVLRSHLRPLKGGLRDVPGALLELAVRWRWANRKPAPQHPLPHPLRISLTSYPSRFPTLGLTLKCLLTQDMAPDCVTLWIAHEDWSSLPAEVLALRADGLDIRRTRDIRSFKKLVPELQHHPDAYIVTADDDVCYPAAWLRELVGGVNDRAEIPAMRVHRIMLRPDGEPEPYLTWSFDIKPGPASSRNMATGVGGVLYPPGSLHPEVIDEQLFMRLCPTNDDLWFYFMARLAGWRVRKVGPRRLFISWPGSQRVALQHVNLAPGEGNDRHLRDLIDYFGSPFLDATAEGAAPPEAPRVAG